MTHDLINNFLEFLDKYTFIKDILLFFGILLTAYFSYLLVKKFVYRWIKKTVRRTKFKWDDVLLREGVFRILIYLVPILVVYYGIRFFPSIAEPISRIIRAVIFLLFTYFLDKVLSSGLKIYETSAIGKKKPIRGYVQMLSIFLYLIGGVIALSIMIGESPWYFLSGIGALAAVMVMVFRETILSFIASIQIATYDLVRVGDWIEMRKFGADGDVIEIALHTVRVQNWDKTITIIPTYKLIDESFKNWRGMAKAGGRRIKRSLLLDQRTIRFCDDALFERLKKVEIIKEYLEQKREEIEKENADREVDLSHPLNGRRLTNVGIFRAYLKAYLQNHPQIRQDMTFLIRQQTPTENGLPIEIYVFSTDIIWANYEQIQSDIFDHAITAAKEFDLKIFQSPSGNDIELLKERVNS